MEPPSEAEPPPASPGMASVVDVASVVAYLKKLLAFVFEEEEGPLVASLFEDQNVRTSLAKFASDSSNHVLSVERTVFKDEAEDRESGVAPSELSPSPSPPRVVYSIDLGLAYRSSLSSVIVLVKRGPLLEADKSLQSQLHVMNLSEEAPFETLHSYMRDVFAPFFKSFVARSGKASREGDKMVPAVQKNISELEIGLLHLQQNIDIPEITLVIHPKVQEVMKEAKSRGERAKAEDFGDLVQDSTFLNSLQRDVGRWIREIQKVTQLERDPSSGTAMQEIRFWLNLERALQKISEKRESAEVKLTLDVLKKGKRFHATVSFDSDTGKGKNDEIGFVLIENKFRSPKCNQQGQRLQSPDEGVSTPGSFGCNRIAANSIGYCGHIFSLEKSQKYPVPSQSSIESGRSNIT